MMRIADIRNVFAKLFTKMLLWPGNGSTPDPIGRVCPDS